MATISLRWSSVNRRDGAAPLEDLLGRSRGVDVDHAHHVVTALHRHANRLANAQFHDAGARAETIVLPGVAGEHALVPLDDKIEDRLADRDLVAAVGVVAGPPHAGIESPRVRIEEHDATPVGLDPLENQLHDAVQQLVDVQRMADRQGRAVHHLEIAACPGQPGVLRQVGLGVEDPAAFFLRDGVDDPRLVVGRPRGGDIDGTADTAVGLLGRARCRASTSPPPAPDRRWPDRCCCTRFPLTKVPLELFRSEMV